jgi:hypothetical protein
MRDGVPIARPIAHFYFSNRISNDVAHRKISVDSQLEARNS